MAVGFLISLLIESLKLLKNNITLKFSKLLSDLLDNTTTVH